MENNKMSVARCRKLLLHFPEQKISFIFFKFENFLLLLSLPISGTVEFTSQLPPYHKDISAERLMPTKPTFSKLVMVSAEVPLFGASAIFVFVEPQVKLSGKHYRTK